MKVLMLSWEFPPFNVGGISQHVYELSRALVEDGVEVDVVTNASSPPYEEEVDGIKVHRVLAYHGHPVNFISWVHQFNFAMMERAASLINSEENFDLIHAHDWLTAYAARGLKHIFHLPMVATIHATEYGRNGGLFTEEQRYIGEIEWWLTYEAWKVICCSRFMEEEIKGVFNLPEDKVQIIPNGIRPRAFQVDEIDYRVKERFVPNQEKIIFFIGRLVKEKGVQDLLRSFPLVREQFPGARFVIAGSGLYEEELRRISTAMGIEDYVHFVGYIDNHTRNQLYQLSSVAVFPSHYEPFGLVALEAMASETPVIVGDVGGFQEIVKHGSNGLRVVPDNPEHLAEQINYLLDTPEVSRKLVENASRDIREKYSWSGVARTTSSTYSEIISSPELVEWRRQVLDKDSVSGNLEEQSGKEKLHRFPPGDFPVS